MIGPLPPFATQHVWGKATLSHFSHISSAFSLQTALLEYSIWSSYVTWWKPHPPWWHMSARWLQSSGYRQYNYTLLSSWCNYRVLFYFHWANNVDKSRTQAFMNIVYYNVNKDIQCMISAQQLLLHLAHKCKVAFKYITQERGFRLAIHIGQLKETWPGKMHQL